jgi:Ca-activated chloride channel family protein
VIVTDRYSRFVNGLGKNSFQIIEDGVPQEITSFSSTEAPFNVALLLDTSHSTQRKLGSIRKAALTFVKQLQPNDRVALVTFDDEVRFVADFTSDRKALEHAIGLVKSNYRTSLYDAIARTVNEKMAAISGRKAIVVLTDGVDTGSKMSNFEQSLELVSSAGVIAYAIQYETRNDGGPIMKPLNIPGVRFMPSSFMPQNQGAGSQTTPRPQDRYVIAAEFLKYLAAASGGRYLRAENIESTAYAFALIADELHNQYTLAYYSSNDKRDGRFREIAVNLNARELFVRARRGYRAPVASDRR